MFFYAPSCSSFDQAIFAQLLTECAECAECRIRHEVKKNALELWFSEGAKVLKVVDLFVPIVDEETAKRGLPVIYHLVLENLALDTNRQSLYAEFKKIVFIETLQKMRNPSKSRNNRKKGIPSSVPHPGPSDMDTQDSTKRAADNDLRHDISDKIKKNLNPSNIL
jgi:hypothetical protein